MSSTTSAPQVLVTDTIKAWREHWVPIFEKEHLSFDPIAADNFLKRWSNVLDLSKISPPDEFTIELAIAKARNSAPGPDGIPFSAW